MNVLISVGAAQLRYIGLNPQRLSEESETRLPARATFTGMDYQRTGRGERTTRLEVLTLPHILGGLDALGWLQLHHQQQDIVNYFRMGANYLGSLAGRVVIRELYIDEERLHPFTGRGRILTAELGLVFV
ncbi:hypothetical protein [Breoghania sp.]|uniref:hypothetical protein n=1 Tax=Breoghania sp. TaxID=2065378 RepID=UPI0029CA9ECE|nr:hypothetical protein [Breoghania sp.]